VTTSLDDAPLSSFHKRLAAYASGGAFMQGYILSITGVAMVQIAPQLNLSPLQQGLVVGSALVGGLPGAYFGGFLADKFGRQTLYSLVLGLTIVCSIASFWATNFVALIIARLLIGVAVGADWPVAQSLVGEFIPRKHRGRLLGFFCVMWFVGAAIAYIVGAVMLNNVGDNAWRWMVLSAAVPGFAFLVLRRGTPESPRWLLSKGRVEDATAVMHKVFGPGVTLSELPQDEDGTASLRTLIRSGYMGRVVFTFVWWTCSVIPLFAIYGFGPAILGALHMGEGMDVIGSAIITVLFLIGTVVAVLLVNRMSRRRMIIGSFAFSGIPLLLLGIFPDSPGSVALALFAMYAVFLGGTQILQAVYPVEMFPTEIRGTAIGLSFALVNTFTTVGTFLVPIVQNKYGIGITVLSGAILTLLGAVICVRFAPETRELTLVEAAKLNPDARTLGQTTTEVEYNAQ
jgi:MFS transporter, putative metabolite transport protein